MRRILMSTLALGLVLAPVAVQAQGPGRMQGAGIGRMQGPAVGALQGRGAGWMQERQGPEPVARILALKGVLELTPAQVTQLEQIQERAKARNQPLIEQLQAARQAMPGRGRGVGPLAAGRGFGPGVQLQRRLHTPGTALRQLPPEQRAAVRDSVQARVQQQRERMQAHREQVQNMTPEQREQLRAQHQQERAAQREQMQEQREQLQPVMEQLRQNAQKTHEEVQSVLTSEQVAKLQELRGAIRPPLRRPGR